MGMKMVIWSDAGLLIFFVAGEAWLWYFVDG